MSAGVKPMPRTPIERRKGSQSESMVSGPISRPKRAMEGIVWMRLSTEKMRPERSGRALAITPSGTPMSERQRQGDQHQDDVADEREIVFLAADRPFVDQRQVVEPAAHGKHGQHRNDAEDGGALQPDGGAKTPRALGDGERRGDEDEPEGAAQRDARGAARRQLAMRWVAAEPAATKSARNRSTAPASVTASPTPRGRHRAPATSRTKPAAIAAAHSGVSAFHRAIAFGVRMRFGEKPTKPRPSDAGQRHRDKEKGDPAKGHLFPCIHLHSLRRPGARPAIFGRSYLRNPFSVR